MTTLANFEPLRPAEARLVAWLKAGNRKDFVLSKSVPAGAGDAVTLRATFIRYLALGGCEDCRLPETGLRVQGAYVEGGEKNSGFTEGLDLEGAILPRDLALLFCHIPDPIILRSARIRNLFLNGSHVKVAIKADRLQAEGGIFLRETIITGEVRLLGSRLGSDLSFIGAKLQGKGKALRCDGMQVEGNVFLRGATIAGEVRLPGAQIGGDLDCVGATLHGERDALICDRAEVAGTFFWRAGAKASVRHLT